MIKHVLAILSTCVVFIGGNPSEAYYIRDMNVDIAVKKDASLLVTERINVDFEGESRHGIYRDILVSEPDGFGGTRRLRVAVTAVTDGMGGVRPYTAFRTGRYYRVKIGKADSTVTGLQGYAITYRVQNGLSFFPDHDELYWDATGVEWPVPILHARCTVHLPEGARSKDAIQVTGYVGPYGSQEAARYEKTTDGAVFETPHSLNYREGMTVAVGWPKGFVIPPSMTQKLWWFISDNAFVFLPFVYLIGFFLWWKNAGRDPDIGVSVTVRYEPPDSLRPAEVGTLIDESADIIDITSTIIDLAVRGYLTLSEQEPNGLFGLGGRSYVLSKVTERKKEDPRGGLSDYEEKIFSKIFGLGDTVNTSELKNSFYTVLEPVKYRLYESLLRRKYFSARPDSIRNTYGVIGLIMMAGGIAFAMVRVSSESSGIAPGWGAAIAVCGLITLLFARGMPRKTAAGRKALLDARGFEEYLRRAEIADIHLQEKKGVFENFLPYAICLGVADRWAKAFEGIYTTPPDWYSGSWGSRGFSPLYLSQSLNGACTNMSAAMVTTPRSASRGGSAFGGGGGFSGGGGGGGGGGAW